MSTPAHPNLVVQGVRRAVRGHVVIVGAGGNIGSSLVPHVARMPGVTRASLIDFDTYELHNLRSQQISAADVGRSKAQVQAARLRAINPALDVAVFAERVESVPLGLLVCVVFALCVDNRRARVAVNEIARRLGIAMIDAAVDGPGLLVRLSGYGAAPESNCLLCGYGAEDFALIEKNEPCQSRVVTAPTNAPSELGALAASFQAIEIAKLVAGDTEHALSGQQILVDARHHQHYLDHYARNPHCLASHVPWHIDTLDVDPAGFTLHQLFRLSTQPATLRVAAQSFVRRRVCANCGRHGRRTLWLSERRPARSRRCPGCGGGPLLPVGFEQNYTLTEADVTPAQLRRPLSRFGFRSGDVVTLTAGGSEVHLQLGGDSQTRLKGDVT